jgi:hypothetical protein
MITGRHAKGIITFTLDANHEKLEAPETLQCERRHWLPCDGCGRVEACMWNVVSYVCGLCTERHEVGRKPFEPIFAEWLRAKSRTTYDWPNNLGGHGGEILRLFGGRDANGWPDGAAPDADWRKRVGRPPED